jgi:pyruvate/2-oxoglutarate/acetoin dehydrogenase E1 component
MPELKYAEAVRAALAAELAADPDVLILGEEVGPLGGVFTVTKDLFEEFGPERVIDTPISENGLVGWAIGIAAEGYRPVVEIMFSDFVILALDQIINLGAKIRFMSNGQFSVPMVIRMPGGGGTNHGPQHSQSLESLFAHFPGLIVAQPATAADAYWMLRDSIRSDDLVIFLESKGLYFAEKGEVDENEGPRGFGARVAREGTDLTVVSAGRMLHRCLDAAAQLEESGVSCEVIDLRYIWPLDTATIAASVERTNKLAVVHEPVEFGGWGAEVAAWASANLFEALDGPVARLGAARVPIPFQPHLEDEVLPSVERIKGVLVELGSY